MRVQNKNIVKLRDERIAREFVTKKLIFYIYKDFVLKAIDTIHHQYHQCNKACVLIGSTCTHRAINGHSATEGVL